MDVRVDHIVLAVPNLAQSLRHVERNWGLQAAGGGRHDGTGTQNAIVPLGGAYLELVTVVSETEARGHGFGTLVLEALEQDRTLAGWVIALGNLPGAGGQRLTRGGVDVMLFGLEGARRTPARPFFLYRAPGQDSPGVLGAGDAHWQVSTLRVGGHTPPLELETAPSGTTRVESVEDAPRGMILEVELTRQDGHRLLLNEESLRTA